MTPDTKAALVVGILAVLIWTPSLWQRFNHWVDRNVDDLVTDALGSLTDNDLRLHPDVRQMRQRQVAASSDWSLWREEMTS